MKRNINKYAVLYWSKLVIMLILLVLLVITERDVDELNEQMATQNEKYTRELDNMYNNYVDVLIEKERIFSEKEAIHERNKALYMTLEEKQVVIDELMDEVDRLSRVIEEISAQKFIMETSEADLYWFAQIIEAEAGICSYEGKLAVANAIINRVYSESFPNTLEEVIFQVDSNGIYQFSPVRNGSINTVIPSDETKHVLYEALMGVNNIGEAVWFLNPSLVTNEKTMNWFNSLEYVDYIDGVEFRK